MRPHLDRIFQQDILSRLAEFYPQWTSLRQLASKESNKELFMNKATVNLAYLEEFKLIKVVWSQSMTEKQPINCIITAKGMDFITDDGGLSAMLGVVTVKLHGDTLRDLMIAKVQETDAEPTVKKNLIDAIKKLPADAMTQLSMAALRQGIDNLPNAIQWFQKLLHFQ